MEIEQKLKEFARLAEEEAELKRRTNLKVINSTIKQKSSDAIKEAKLTSKHKIEKELYKLNEIKNKKLIDAEVYAKKNLINLREQYKKNIFLNVEKELHQYTKTKQYKNNVIASIQKVSRYITILYLTNKDISHLADKIKKIDADINVLESDEDFIGGFKAVLKCESIIIDNSFKTKLLNEKERFNSFKIV